MRNLRGRTAVITGGGDGLGAAMARRFGAEGMRVLVADLHLAAARGVAEELQERGVVAAACPVVIGDAASVRAMATAARNFGGCDLLCANVGVQRIDRFDGLEWQDWEWLVRVNLLGTVETVREMLPLLRSGDHEKHIVVTSSVCGLFAAPNLAAYNATKFAVSGFAETLRIELAAEGIGVTVFYPGIVATGHLQSSAAARPTSLGPNPQLDVDRVREATAALVSGPADVATAEHATRNLVAAVEEDRPYLVSHGGTGAAIRERLNRLEDALARADE